MRFYRFRQWQAVRYLWDQYTVRDERGHLLEGVAPVVNKRLTAVYAVFGADILERFGDQPDQPAALA